MTHTKNNIRTWIFAVAAWLLTAVSAYFLLTRTPAGVTLQAPETGRMILELAVVALWVFCCEYFISSLPLSLGLGFLGCYVFCWLHRIALPLLLSGIYVAGLVVVGEAFYMILRTWRPGDKMQRYAHDFLAGSAIQITLTGILSLFGKASVTVVRLEAILLIAFSVGIILLFQYSFLRVGIPMEELPSDAELEEEQKHRLLLCLVMAGIAAMLLLQAGRINITLDYDSLHYGLRPQYILDNGHGIFENLGTVNDVYVYPKGLEILTLPLVSDTTVGYLLGFNWWMIVGVLALLYAVVRSSRPRRVALYATLAASCIPGLMNMACSAKTDAITLLFQLMLILDVVIFCGKDEKNTYLATALAAAVMTVNFKPTAFLFTGILVVISIIYIWKTGGVLPVKRWKNLIWICVPSVLSLMVTMGRTLRLTGLPVTSVATSVFRMLGFTPRYPYGSVDAFEGGANLWKRLIGVFACPVGTDMSHVYIAWGTVAVTLLIVVALYRTWKKPKEDTYLKILLLAILPATIVCLALLYQVDGNYFMLLYVLAVAAGWDCGTSEKNQGTAAALLPALVVGAALCLVTNWAGVSGFTPVKVNHYGYYDHTSDGYDRMMKTGNFKIYEYLERDRTQRVVAFADQPGCFDFRCNVQSYTDIEGSGGNVAVVKTLEEFKKFLDWAGTQYIYTNDAFLQAHGRAGEIIGYMIDENSLEIVLDEGENKLYQYQTH